MLLILLLVLLDKVLESGTGAFWRVDQAYFGGWSRRILEGGAGAFWRVEQVY
jgi:hypothetical protein